MAPSTNSSTRSGPQCSSKTRRCCGGKPQRPIEDKMSKPIDLKEWFDEHRITEVECLVPDITGIPRGKIMPAQKFFQGGAPRLPEAIFIQSVTGEYPDDPTDALTDPAIIDIKLIPDASTVRL